MHLQQPNGFDLFSIHGDLRIEHKRYGREPVVDYYWSMRPLLLPIPHRPFREMPGFYPSIQGHLWHGQMVRPIGSLRIHRTRLVYFWCVSPSTVYLRVYMTCGLLMIVIDCCCCCFRFGFYFFVFSILWFYIFSLFLLLLYLRGVVRVQHSNWILLWGGRSNEMKRRKIRKMI